MTSGETSPGLRMACTLPLQALPSGPYPISCQVLLFLPTWWISLPAHHFHFIGASCLPWTHPKVILQSPGRLTSPFLCILLPDLPEAPLLYKNARLARWSSGEKTKLIGALGSCLNPHGLSICGLVRMRVCFSSHDVSFPNAKPGCRVVVELAGP